MALKAYGISISNYYSTLKTALIEKNISFEEIATFPSAKPDVLALSPMGKVPYIEVNGEGLSETNVIFDYLEDTYPEPALYPADPWARAKAKEIIRTVELYIDFPARKHIATVYFGQPVDEALLEPVKAELEKGLSALKALAKFSPYIAGDAFGFADIAAYFQLRFANLHTQQIYDWDFISADDALSNYFELVGERPSIKEVDAILQRDFAAMQSK
ncbi:MAG: glutathione S-transferase family protein [Gammaproteobacteria bacterium]